MTWLGVFRREFWVADAELSAHLSAIDEDIDRRQKQARSNDDIVMPFRRDVDVVAMFAAIPGMVAGLLLVGAVMVR